LPIPQSHLLVCVAFTDSLQSNNFNSIMSDRCASDFLATIAHCANRSAAADAGKLLELDARLFVLGGLLTGVGGGLVGALIAIFALSRVHRVLVAKITLAVWWLIGRVLGGLHGPELGAFTQGFFNGLFIDAVFEYGGSLFAPSPTSNFDDAVVAVIAAAQLPGSLFAAYLTLCAGYCLITVALVGAHGSQLSQSAALLTWVTLAVLLNVAVIVRVLTAPPLSGPAWSCLPDSAALSE
jgi:hypothetical protein